MEVNFAAKVPSAAPAPAGVTPQPAPTPAATAQPQPAPAPTIDVAATVTTGPAVTPTPAPAPAPVPSTTCNPEQSALTAPLKSNSALAPIGLVLGDKIPDFDDIILPRLNIVQNIGDLKDMFPPGGIVFNQLTLLFTPPIAAVVDKATGTAIKPAVPATPPINIVCLGFRPTRFVEKVQGGVRGMIVKTEDEVRANGGTLDYNEWKLKAVSGMKRFEALAEALVVIERPVSMENDGTVFVYTVNGKEYALALWAMKGTAYTAAAKRVFFTGRATGCLRGGYPSRGFAMTTRWQSYEGGNGAWIPVLIPQKPSSPEFLAWVGSVLNPPAVPADQS